MTKTKLKELMKKHCILPCELDDVIEFVTDLLYEKRRELETNEPYAYRTIDDIYKAEIQVNDLIDYISELEEDENESLSGDNNK